MLQISPKSVLRSSLFCLMGLLLATFDPSCRAQSSATPLEFTYQQPTQTVLNPDGGPWIHVDLLDPRVSVTNLQQRKVVYPEVTIGPLRLLHAYICLNPVGPHANCRDTYQRTGPLTASDLETIDEALQKAEDARIKLIVRFVYNASGTGQDAPLNQILQDINSVAPLVQKHKNIIYALQAGFIGAYGEGHDSDCGPDCTNDTADQIHAFMAAEEAAFGPYTFLMNRLPSNIMDWEPRGNVIWGIHDDDYASGTTDSHTWNPPTWARFRYTLNTLQHFAGGRSDQLPFSAELACAGQSTENCDNASPEGTTFVDYSKRFHLNSLNIGGQIANLDEDQRTEALLHVGPVIALTRASLDTAPALGSSSTLSLSFLNSGFSRLFVPVPVYLVLTDAAGNELSSDLFPPVRVPIDLTQMASNGGELTASVKVTFPVGLLSQMPYYAALRLPDPDLTLSTMHEYNYLLNNLNVPIASTGLNRLFLIQF